MNKDKVVAIVNIELSLPVVAIMGSVLDYCLQHKDDYTQNRPNSEEVIEVMKYLKDQLAGILLQGAQRDRSDKTVVN